MKMSHKSTHVSSLDSSNSSKIKLNSYRQSSRLVGAKKVHGFDTQLISLKKMVQQRQSSDPFKAVAVVGKRGVGKTTLCQELFKKPEVQADFLPRIWVCMSWKPTEYGDRKITTVWRMLTCLGVDDKTIQSISDSVPEADRLSSLLYALHLQLTGKKYLIVLDDAIEEGDDSVKEGDDADNKKKEADDAFKERNKWLVNLDSPITEKEKWGECLAFGLPKGHGGTVIVTSRDEKLAKVMVGEKNLLHLLPLLDPQSCASIFNDHVKGEQELKEDLEKKEFLKKCAGLPLAATMMGKIKSDELAKAAKEAAEKAAKEAKEAAEKAAKEAAEKAAKEAPEKAAKEAAEKAAKEATEKAAKEAAEKAAKEATEKAAKEAAEKAAKEAAEKAAKEPAKKMEPESPISFKDEEKNKTGQLHTGSNPIQPDEAAKSSKDDKETKSEEVPAGEKHIQQQEKDARSSIGSKDDKQIISEEHPAESEPRPQQEGTVHNEIHEEAASGTN